MYSWYNTDPFRKFLTNELGPEKGQQFWRDHIMWTSPMSAANSVDKEIAKGTWAHLLSDQPDNLMQRFFDTKNLPEGMGHVAHTTAHGAGVRNLLDTNLQRFWKENNPEQKIGAYAWQKMMDAFGVGVPDAHNVRSFGLPDVRPLVLKVDKKKGKAEWVPDGGSINRAEFGPLNAWAERNIAKPLGMTPGTVQPVSWGAFSNATGVETPIGAPYAELVLQGARKAAERRGVSPKQALLDYVHKTGPDAYLGQADIGLLGGIGAATGGGLYAAKKSGLLDDDEKKKKRQ
jgi:hypothetical protein